MRRQGPQIWEEGLTRPSLLDQYPFLQNEPLFRLVFFSSDFAIIGKIVLPLLMMPPSSHNAHITKM